MVKNYLINAITRTSMVFLVAAVCVSCNIDDSYDLSDINDGEMGIGTDDTEFKFPIATIKVDVGSVLELDDDDAKAAATRGDDGDDNGDDSTSSDNSANIGQIESLSSFMPTGEEIDTMRLDDDVYVGGVVESLIEELGRDSDKCLSFCEAINDGGYTDVEDSVTALKGVQFNGDDLATTAADLQTALNDSANESLIDDLKESVKAEIKAAADYFALVIPGIVDDVDIDKDTIELITKNLDGDKNRIYLRVSYTHDFPEALGVSISTTLDYQDESGCLISVTLKDIRDSISENDSDLTSANLAKLLEHLTFTSNLNITSYTSNGESLSDMLMGTTLGITIVIVKSGSLKW